MEELRSTEVLAREILEDAHRKANKILKSAEESQESQARDWEKRTLEAINSIRKSYEDRIKKDSDEIFLRLPLDKRRLRSEAAENYLVKAMDDFLRSLPRETLLSVLERELTEHLGGSNEDLALSDAEISYSGLSLPETRELLAKVYVMGNLKFREDPNSHQFPWIVIYTRTARIFASVEKAAAALLKNKRAELASALLGDGVLND